MIDLPDDRKARPWIIILTLFVYALFLAVRLGHAAEIPGAVGIELDGARRILHGEITYVDFYTALTLPVFVWRFLTLLLTPLVSCLFLHPLALDEAFYHASLLGLASVAVTNLLVLVSAFCSFKLLQSKNKNSAAADYSWLFLLACGLANLAMGVEYGGQQHIFVLLALPYAIARWLAWEKCAVSARRQIFSAAAAAFGASFSVLNVLILLFVEMVEILRRREGKPLLQPAFLSFTFLSLALWSHLLFLSSAQKEQLWGWIWPAHYAYLTHSSFVYYGLASTPERSILVYLGGLAIILAMGLQTSLPAARPLAVLTGGGLFAFMSLVTGMSSDGLILTYFLTVLLVIEFFVLALYAVRTYPRLFKRGKRLAIALLTATGTVLVACALIATEVTQRKLVKTGATRLQREGVTGSRDLESIIKSESAPGDKIMIVNDSARPAYPILTDTGRASFGYFMGTQALGEIEALRQLKNYNTGLRVDEKFVERTQSMLYARLFADMLKYRPKLFCLQTGDPEITLNHLKGAAQIYAHYERVSEGEYFSDHVGTREIAEPNYTYWIYRLKK